MGVVRYGLMVGTARRRLGFPQAEPDESGRIDHKDGQLGFRLPSNVIAIVLPAPHAPACASVAQSWWGKGVNVDQQSICVDLRPYIRIK